MVHLSRPAPCTPDAVRGLIHLIPACTPAHCCIAGALDASAGTLLRRDAELTLSTFGRTTVNPEIFRPHLTSRVCLFVLIYTKPALLSQRRLRLADDQTSSRKVSARLKLIMS